MTIDAFSASSAPKSRPHGDCGFSLMEAMVVLIVAGVALTLLFSIAGRAAQIGFGLGGRALAEADSALAEENLRAAVRALVIPPRPSRQDSQNFVGAETRLTAKGDARAFRGEAIFDRPTLCADRGPARPLGLRLERRAGGDALICETPRGAKLLMDLTPRRARLAYSVDGLTWSDHWPTDSEPADIPPGQPQTLYIRLSTDDGARDIVDRARTSYAAAKVPPQARTAGLGIIE